MKSTYINTNSQPGVVINTRGESNVAGVCMGGGSSMSEEEGRGLISDMLRREVEGVVCVWGRMCACVCVWGGSPLTWGGYAHVPCSPDGPSLL